MNYQEIHQYAKNTEDFEFVDLIESAKQLFDKYSVPDWEQEVGNLIVSNSDDSDSNIKDAIRSNLDSIINFILRMSNIEVIDNILISEKISILNGLYDIETYEDKDSIVDILQTDVTNEEKLSTVLQLLTNLETDRLLSIITEVSDDLIKTIAITLLPDNLDEIKEQAMLVEKQINAYTKFKKHIGNKELFSDQYFINLETVGLSLSVYLNTYTHTLPKLENDSLNVDQIVLDLYGLIILSEQFSPVTELVNKNMYLITNDPTASTKISTEISKLLIKVNNA